MHLSIAPRAKCGCACPASSIINVPNSYGFGTKDQWIVGYTPDIVLATWVGFDQTSKQRYMQGVSETGITRLYKAEMEGILPYTAQTQFFDVLKVHRLPSAKYSDM